MGAAQYTHISPPCTHTLVHTVLPLPLPSRCVVLHAAAPAAYIRSLGWHLAANSDRRYGTAPPPQIHYPSPSSLSRGERAREELEHSTTREAAAMDMGGGHDMGGMTAPPTAGGTGMRMRYTHMTFFWGKNSEILFTGWPGTSGGMYALALVVVFVLAFVLEFLGSRRLDALLPSAAAGSGGRRSAAASGAAGAARAAVYAVRVGGAYLLMLALMSFNGGVLLVAVAGHAAGFLAFKAGLFGDGRAQNKEEIAPAACC
ncbi:unnamed protein product [Urochloa humidicola]